MAYLVTGSRRQDGWPFSGEIAAGSGADAAAIVRRWGVEPDFVQHVASGRVEFSSPDEFIDAATAVADDEPASTDTGPDPQAEGRRLVEIDLDDRPDDHRLPRTG